MNEGINNQELVSDLLMSTIREIAKLPRDESMEAVATFMATWVIEVLINLEYTGSGEDFEKDLTDVTDQLVEITELITKNLHERSAKTKAFVKEQAALTEHLEE